MNAEASSRPRLAAVVFTDVVGYSARMQRDEGETIADVQADFASMREACTRHRGEVLNTMGDGMMLCFGSAVQAVAFALEVQGAFAERHAQAAAGSALQHRIGIHLGDVFRVEGGHVAGDGVNIAARIESSAPAGGTCISQTVYDTVKGKVAMQADFMGPKAFKNIAQPIPVWRIAAAGSHAAGQVKAPLATKRALIAGASALIALGAGGVFWVRKDVMPGAGEPVAREGGDNKSIAVLPFTNMSADKDASYFADGVHEDLLTQLALLGGLKVVSRTSVMEYRNSAKNMRQIGKELGVASLVEGSVRRAGNQVRVTAQLIDARADQHLWANNYDREIKDIFAVQSEIASSIASALRVSLSPPEQQRLARKPTENLEAYDLFLRHQALVNSSTASVRSISSVLERAQLLAKAVELDPKFGLAWARLAAEHGRARGYGLDSTDERKAKAQSAMARALALDPDDLQVKTEEGAFQLHAMDDHDKAKQAYRRVLKQAPNNVPALIGLAEVLNELLETPEAVSMLERAVAVDARNVGAVNRLSGTCARYRIFDRCLALKRQLIEIRPDSVELRANYFLHEYWATGSWQGYDKWRATLPPGSDAKYARVRNTDADRVIARGDLAAVHRLADLDTEDLKGAKRSDAGVAAAHALVYFALGDAVRARAGARAAVSLADAEIRKEPGDESVYMDKADMLALLGERGAALSTFDQGIKAMGTRGNRHMMAYMHARIIDVHALLGEKDKALEKLRARLRQPGGMIHDLRLRLALLPMSKDPAFQAIVDDPASNAPIPLTTLT